MTQPQQIATRRSAGFSGLQVFGIVAVTVLLAAGVTVWVLRATIYPKPFEPVALTSGETLRLDGKLRAIGFDPPTRARTLPPTRSRTLPPTRSRTLPPPLAGRGEADVAAAPRAPLEPKRLDPEPRNADPLEPEAYREDASQREIAFSERELNGLLAHNTNLAQRLAIDLSDDLASAKLLIPVDPDFPFFGGKTLRVHTGVQLQYEAGRPVVILRGISLMGVPLPNAWLGNLKNVDLVEYFGGAPGFWKQFAAGVEHMQVREGELQLKLRE